MVLVYIIGMMVENTKECMNKIKNMVMEYLPGLMGENMTDNGQMVYNMGMVSINHHQNKNQLMGNLVNGKKVKDKNG